MPSFDLKKMSSKFFSSKYKDLEAYTPGEQPRDMKYVKLNTNESPYPPTPAVLECARAEAGKLNLYSDPTLSSVITAFSSVYGIDESKIIMTNGSDEALNFAFMAYGDDEHPFAFADITYGFYSVFAKINRLPYEIIPLKDDFSIDYKDYLSKGKNIVIANPNAPTGLTLPLWQIEEILKTNPENIVIIDEAYVDFGAESAMGLVDKYDNLIVVGTFSKSRSLAGARLGFAVANPAIISDLNTIRFSTNPYNINRMTMAVGVQVLLENAYYMDNCKRIIETREYTKARLSELGFEYTDSKANFLFCKSPDISGEELYLKLKARGVLVRHFGTPRIKDYNRITIGTREQMDILLKNISEILEEKSK